MKKVCGKHGIEYTKSGNSMRCLKCDRERKGLYAKEHAEEMRRYRQSEDGKTTKRKYRQSDKGKAAVRRYRQSNYNKILARKAIEYALRKGNLIVPDVCSQCKLHAKVESHHHNGYEKSCQLDVVWVCHSCHMSLTA